MYTNALHESLNPLNLIKLIKYKLAFKREHPDYFEPCGTAIFCGSQGSGKTLSGVNYCYRVLADFPHAILCTNTKMRDFPFNAHLDGERLIDNATGELITSDKILDGTFKNVCCEYSGLDCLKFINNGEYGVIFFIDEFHLELNSLESKNVDIDVMIEISQQRKQRKHIVGTSQIFERLAKPVREQIKDVIKCKCFFGCIQWNKRLDGETAVEKNGKLTADVKGRYLWFHNPDMYERYDTYQKMKRYNKEWNGRSRQPVQFFKEV